MFISRVPMIVMLPSSLMAELGKEIPKHPDPFECSPYLLRLLRTEAQARRDIDGVSNQQAKVKGGRADA